MPPSFPDLGTKTADQIFDELCEQAGLDPNALSRGTEACLRRIARKVARPVDENAALPVPA